MPAMLSTIIFNMCPAHFYKHTLRVVFRSKGRICPLPPLLLVVQVSLVTIKSGCIANNVRNSTHLISETLGNPLSLQIRNAPFAVHVPSSDRYHICTLVTAPVIKSTKSYHPFWVSMGCFHPSDKFMVVVVIDRAPFLLPTRHGALSSVNSN